MKMGATSALKSISSAEGRSDVRRGDDQRESDDVYLHGLSFVIGRPTLRVGMFDLDRYSSSSSVRKAVPATIILISSF